MSPTTEPRDIVRAIWQTRPTRRQSDRKFAGVAGAIARRYDIDPVLVRIGFVVAAFYSIGIVAYLAAWLALPADRNDPPTGPLASRPGGRPHPLVVVVAAIAACGTALSLLHGKSGALIGLVVIAGLLYLLHQNRADLGLPGDHTAAPPAPAAGDSTAGGGAAGGGAAGGGAAVGEAPTTEIAGTGDPAGPAEGAGRPPAWDPLGAAPFAWDLPEPTPAPTPPAARRWRLTLVTIAVALIAGAVTGMIGIGAHGVGGVRLVIGVMLAVLGLGLVVGAFLHRGRGLILLAVPLMVLAYGVTKAPLTHWQDSGRLAIAPTSVSELAPHYDRGFGSVHLDLSRLDLAVPSATPPVAPAAPARPPAAPGATPPPAPPVPPVAPAPLPVRTEVTMQAGDVKVLLPPDANVTVHCHTDVGTVQCLGQRRDGEPGGDVRASDPGRAAPDQRPLDIDVTVGAGTVSVDRG